MGIFDLLKGKGFTKAQYERHRDELEKKIGEALAKGDSFQVAWLYQLMARLARKKGDYDKCIQCLMKAVGFSEKSGKKFNTGWLYRIASQAALDKKDYSKAVQYALKAAEYFSGTKCIYATQWSYNIAVKASEARGDVYSAIRYCKKSLDIEENEELKEKLHELKLSIPHPVVKVSCGPGKVKEGEQCEFMAVVKNPGKEVLRRICLLDDKGRAVEKLERLYPGDSRVFSYKTTGKMGVLHSRYKTVGWRSPGGVMVMPLEPPEVGVVPNVSVETSINPRLRLGKPSDFVVLIRNNSSSAVTDVRFWITFPKEIRVRRETQDSFYRILPGDEKGVVYTLVPAIVGETVARDLGVEYKDSSGSRHKDGVTPVVFREALEEEPVPTKTRSEVEQELGAEGLKHLERAREKKGYIKKLITANPMSEADYLLFADRARVVHRGFILAGVSLDTISDHILQVCQPFTLIGMREFRDERVFLFSGRSQTEVRAYLLTIALKKQGKAVNVVFKAYSDKKPGLEKFLDTIADIVKYTIITMSFAREVEKIEVKKVINIIDSIVQRSDIGGGPGVVKNSKVRIKDSIVQRSRGV